MQAAAAALQAALTFEHPADAVLRRFFREHPELGQQDRGFVADSVFAVLRNLRLLGNRRYQTATAIAARAALAFLSGRSLRQLEPLLRQEEPQWLTQRAPRTSCTVTSRSTESSRLGLGPLAGDTH